HAKCHVDGGFGHIKTLYKRSDCESMNQLVAVVNKSSVINIAVRYPAWPWRNWTEFLEDHFKALAGIRILHSGSGILVDLVSLTLPD
ncbi:hypothetical protein DPMN_110591, partial [Dreissena polymorpha]